MPKSRLFRNVSRLAEKRSKRAGRKAQSALERKAAMLLSRGHMTRMAVSCVVLDADQGKSVRAPASDLQEALPGGPKDAAHRSGSRRTWISRHLAKLYSEDRTSEPRRDSESQPTRYEALLSFFLHSKAYEIFRTDMLDFMHRPYGYRVTLALRVMERKPVVNHSVVGGSEIELSWVPPSLFSIVENARAFRSDKVKSWVEDTLRQKVNWWPLQQRVDTLNQGFARLCWLTVSSL